MVLLPDEHTTTDEYFKLANTPDEFELEIVTVLNPEQNTSLEGLYLSGGILCTQCEAEGFRKITPFPDRPDVLTTYSCTIVADKTKYPILLSNGNLVKSGDLDGNRHFVVWNDPFKKPCYLFAMVAGDLAVLEDQFIAMSGRKIDLKIYSEKENIDQCGHAMSSLKQAMKWDEERFGLEYDLDLYQIVAINDFNAGAMENKGLNIFNSKYVLAKPETATDDDFKNIQGVIGHEYFHNWTGNRVTLKNWFQLSLKEGLTVFRDQEFSSDLNSRGVKRILSVRNLRAFQFSEDSGPMAHPVRPDSYIEMNNFYTMTVYEKGAEIVRMIHQILGEALFQDGMKLYFKKFDGQAVTIEDFICAMEESSRIDLTQFKLWYSQSGTPIVKIHRQYDSKKQVLHITFEQVTPPDRNQDTKPAQLIPVKLGILDRNGNDLLAPDLSLIKLKKNRQTFSFNNMPDTCVPSYFREFSAPVKVETDLTKEELSFLMGHDTDEFNRWDAAQTLFMDEIKRFIVQIQNDELPVIDIQLVKAIEKALKSPNLDRALLSKVITLPSETEIKDHITPVDVEAVHNARQSVEKQIAQQFESLFYQIIDDCSKADPKSLSHEAMACRSLKNQCLNFLGALKSKETTALVFDHFMNAKNMTDEVGAFKILCDINAETKQKAAGHFYQKWKGDPLVLDKWFAIQAGSMLDDTPDRLRELVEHHQFSIKNPNKVRSLIFMFAMFNPINFHDRSGRNYSFISDRIIELDKINPQIAARLATCFNHRKKYDPDRNQLMKSQLERIAATDDLSRNVYEIVSKALE